MDRNPSIFIRLPRLSGTTKWLPDDIVEVLDMYGDIKEVSIKKDSHGGQFAVVHFNEWYDRNGTIANAARKGKPFRVRALYGRTFNLILFQVKRPEANKVSNAPLVPKVPLPSVPEVPIAPGISFGNPGQLSAAEFVEQKRQNEIAAFNFKQILDYHNDTLPDILMRRHRSDSGVSDITMEDDFEGTEPHYYRHYQLEEGEIV